MTKTHYYQAVRDPRPLIDWRAMLTQAAFGVALAVMAGRCMVLETIRDPFEVAVGSTPYPLGAGADTSLVLDLLCCLPALLVLTRRCVDKTYTLRWNWSLVLLLPLVAWMAASVSWADDKFASLISSANYIAGMALLWAMSQIVRSWTRLRIVAAVAFGLLLVFLVKGFCYKFIEMPELLLQQKSLLREEGLDPHSYSGTMFALKFTELMGFNSSANSFAGLIVLFLIIGLGVAIQRIKDKDDPAWTVALALSAPLSIWLLIYAESKAAMVMPILALAMLAVLWKWHGRMARESKRFFWIGTGLFSLGIFAAVAHGLYHHGLPTSSLNFRWRYWVGSWRMFLQHPLRGVGWENFGPHYLRDRLPPASEEIRDPHDFIVRFLVELGAVGGVLMLAWLGRLWWELTRPVAPPAVAAPLATSPKWSHVLLIAAVALGTVLVHIWASIDFNQPEGYVIMGLIYAALYLCAMLIGSLVVALRSLEKPQVDERSAPWILYGILVGVGVFLIHNLIEFSMFEAGPLCLWAVLLGSALGIRLGNPPVRKPAISPIAIGALSAAALIWLAALYWLAVPVTRAEMAAHAGDDKVRAGDLPAASDEYDYAFSLVPTNADYAFRAGRALHFTIVAPEAPLSDPKLIDQAFKLRMPIETYYSLAIAKDPVMLNPLRFRAIFELQIGEIDKALQDWQKVMELNPNEVSLRLEYAKDLDKVAMLAEEKKQLQLALKYNDQLDAAEPKRLAPAQVDEIQKKIASLPG